MPETVVKLAETLDFPQIIFQCILTCVRTRDIDEYSIAVENLVDAMRPWWDERFEDDLKRKKIRPDLSNPYFDALSKEKKRDYARSLFRSTMRLIQRSGFLPEKIIEGVLDEATVDAIIEATT